MKSPFIDFETLIALLPGHVYWLDRDNIYQGCNDMQARSAGLVSRHDIIGKRNKDLPWTADNTALNDKLDNTNFEIMESGIARILEESGVLSSGAHVTYLSHKIPLRDKDKNVIGLLCMSIDITDRKNQENALKVRVEQAELTIDNIVANMPGHVYWKDKDGIYLGSNDRQARSLGLRFGHELVGKTDFDLPWKEEIACGFRENDLRIMENGNAEIVEEIAQVDGKQAIVLSQKTPLRNRRGSVVGVLGISIDITERKQMEASLKEAKENAEIANKLKADFIHNMEHDIRTPFNGIWMLANLLEAEESDPDKKETLNDISGCAKELLDYCNSILEFAQTEAGVVPIIAKKFSLKTLLNRLRVLEIPPAKVKKLKLTVDMAENVPDILIGDERRLERILINLVSNAIKFTNNGYVKVYAKLAKKITSKQAVIRILIEDSGIGISDDKQAFIYEKFTRLTPTNQGIYKGSGLGLRVVKQLIEEVEGEIDVKSSLGSGTTFICTIPFTLPLVDEILDEDAIW